jgi:NTP pyrophosphatase (non-canonical NTP hydrolase)
VEIKQIQEYATYLSVENGWDKESLETRVAYLKSEVNEVLTEVDNYNNTTDTEERSEIKTNLGHELFDLIWNVAELANRFDIDLATASEQKMAINSNRTFSASPEK